MTSRGEGRWGGQSLVISSLQNERIKLIRALAQRKMRRETGLFVVEGADMLARARRQGFAPTMLVRGPDAHGHPLAAGLKAWADHARADVLDVTLPVLEKLGSADNPQQIMAVLQQRWSQLPELGATGHHSPAPLAGGDIAPPPGGEGLGVGGLQNTNRRDSPAPQPSPTRWEGEGRLASGETGEADLGAPLPPDATWLALEGIRDPGNLGTILRTAEAAGVTGVVLVGDCCDPFSREAVRGSVGSLFAVPIAKVDVTEFLAWRQLWPGDVVGARAEEAEDFRAAAIRLPALIVMGSERDGLSEALARACTRHVRIPMAGEVESLNLAVASALMLYQVRARWLA